MPSSPLFTDLYELTMAEAYLASNKESEIATFELFFRKCPFGGEYAVLAGFDLVQEILENFKFSQDDLSFLKSLPSFEKASPRFFELLKNFNLDDVEVLGIDEGEIVFPRIPLLQIKGPIYKVQLLESALLNAINFATLVATYARRIRLIAKDKSLIEFGLRRAQGPNGAMTAARSSFVGGFDGTSNVLAAKNFGIPVVGTMAHSFIQSFCRTDNDLNTNGGEFAAFEAYAKVFPKNCLLLVDTYDTLKSGVPNAIRIFKSLREQGHEPLGVRLDSGDLVYLSKMTRRMLDEAGFPKAKIFASNELDENVIASIQDQGALIDAYCVGTHLTTASAQPALGGVYKLVEVLNKPRMKISQQTEKLVLPSEKKLYRLMGKDGKMLADIMKIKSEAPPRADQEELVLHPTDAFKRAHIVPSKVRPLLKPLFSKGVWLDRKSLFEKRTESMQKMDELRNDITRRQNPTPYKVSISPELKNLVDDLYAREAPAARIE